MPEHYLLYHFSCPDAPIQIYGYIFHLNMD